MAFLLKWHLFVDCTLILHSGSIIFTNGSSSYTKDVFNTSFGLNQFVAFADNYRNSSHITSLLNNVYNNLLSVYFSEQNFQAFSIDNPMVSLRTLINYKFFILVKTIVIDIVFSPFKCQ